MTLGGEGQLQLHQASHVADSGGGVTTNSGIVQKIKLLDPIKLHNLGGELPARGVGAKFKFCQKFWSGRFASNTSQSILG